MRQPGLYLGVNIFLDLGPVFWFIRGVLRDQRAKVSGLDSGEDSALGHAVEVIDDCTKAWLD